MLKDVAETKKLDKEAILAAIRAVKAKGWDLNPYTVADEANVPRALLYRDVEIMEMIARERGAPSTVKPADEIIKRVSELEDQNRSLEELVHTLEQEKEGLKVQVQEAWQQGYQDCMEETVSQISSGEAGLEAQQVFLGSEEEEEEEEEEIEYE